MRNRLFIAAVLVSAGSTGISCHGALAPATATTSTSTTSTSGTSDSTGDSSAPCTGLSTTAGLQVWLDASSLNAGDGGSVGTWNDCNNGALAAAQATAANQPTFSATGGPGDMPYVSFNGTSGFLTLPGSQLDFSAGMTVFMVASFPSGNDWRYILDRTNYNSSTSSFEGFEFALMHQNIFITIFNGSGYGDGGTYVADHWYIANFNLAAGDTSMSEFQNAGPAALDQVYLPYSGGTTDLQLFGHNQMFGNPTHGGAGKLAELILFNGKLSDSDRQAINCYLNSKYSLGSPYCE